MPMEACKTFGGDFVELTRLFKVLSDDTRLRILALLMNRSLCVCMMCEVLDLSQPNVSKHLAKLRDIGLVKDERHEQFIYYKLKRDNILLSNILFWINENIDSHEILKIDREKLLEMKNDIEHC